MKNVKNNTLTNDDLVYIHLCTYTMHKNNDYIDKTLSVFHNLTLTINDDNSALSQAFKANGGSINI